MADTTQTRRILIKVDTSGASGLNQTAKQLEQLNKTTSDLSGGMTFLTRIFKGLAVAFVATEIRTFITDVINTGTELKNMSQALGISVESLAKIKVSAELSGVSTETLSMALRRLSVNAVAATTGNTQMEKSFKAFGITVADLRTLDPSQLLLKMADGYKRLADGEGKAALTTKIFGRSGTDITPMLNLASDGILRFGLRIDNEFATSAKQFTNNVQIMKLELRNLVIDGFGSALPALNEAIEKWDILGKTNDVAKEKSKALAGIVTLLAIAVKTVVDIAEEFADLLVTVYNEALDLVIGNTKGFIAVLDEMLDRAAALGRGDFQEAFFSDSSKALDVFSKTYSKVDKEGQEFADRSKKRFLDVALYAQDLEDKLEFGPDKGAKEGSKPKVDPSEINKKLAHERELLEVLKAQGVEQAELGELELRKYKLSTVEYENEKDRYKTQQDIIKATKEFDKTNPQEAKLAQQYKTMAELQEQAREQNRLDLESQKQGIQGFSTGATEAFKDYLENAKDTAAQTKTFFSDTFKNMEDGIFNFVKTGKFSFADFANAVIDDIIRIQIRLAIAGLIGQVVGAFSSGAVTGSGETSSSADYHYTGHATGGVMTDRGPMALQKYSQGGIANSPQLAMFGEGRTPEAYVPLPNGKSIPVEMSNGGGTNVVVNVNVENGTSSSKADNANVSKLGAVIANVVKKQLIQEKRQGGLLAK